MILCENGPEGAFVRFDADEIVTAYDLDEVGSALAYADAARSRGAYIAGWMSYEAGLAFEPRLRGLACGRSPWAQASAPLLALGICGAPQTVDPSFLSAAQGEMSPPEPLITPSQYAAAFARLKDYIAAGDCYQVNLTFPMRARLKGEALGLYAALRARQPVGFGGYADFGAGLPIMLSRSPELFFETDAQGGIHTRPMKGTAPRDLDPERDQALARELSQNDKTRAENLMIVDLLRNDLARISQVGSVRVPELFAVESFSTLHQMSSSVTAQLIEPASLSRLMPALFPCGSVTGAPKIRAMEIIAELEPFARQGYCGAFGWMAPDGASRFNVTIRTLSLRGDEIVMNVGGGIVADSECQSEWEEALWKARFAMPPMSS